MLCRQRGVCLHLPRASTCATISPSFLPLRAPRLLLTRTLILMMPISLIIKMRSDALHIVRRASGYAAHCRRAFFTARIFTIFQTCRSAQMQSPMRSRCLLPIVRILPFFFFFASSFFFHIYCTFSSCAYFYSFPYFSFSCDGDIYFMRHTRR